MLNADTHEKLQAVGATGLRLARIDRRERLILCEAMRFPGGASSVALVLNRASISGRVEIAGKVENHFADVLDENGDMVETVALDPKSYAALKNKWMRCKVDTALTDPTEDTQP